MAMCRCSPGWSAPASPRDAHTVVAFNALLEQTIERARASLWNIRSRCRAAIPDRDRSQQSSDQPGSGPSFGKNPTPAPYRSELEVDLLHGSTPGPPRSGGLRGARADRGHDDLRHLLGVGDHGDVRCPFDLGHLRAHPVVAEPVDTGVDAPVGGRKHRPDRTAAPGRGRCGLGERDRGKGALGDRVERGVAGRDVGAEGLVKALQRKRELAAAFGQLVLDDVRDDPRRGGTWTGGRSGSRPRPERNPRCRRARPRCRPCRPR